MAVAKQENGRIWTEKENERLRLFLLPRRFERDKELIGFKR